MPKQLWKNWESFYKTGFLLHKQTQIKTWVYPMHPATCLTPDATLSLHRFIDEVKPDMVAIQMGDKTLLPDLNEHIEPVESREPSGPALIVGSSYREAVEVSQQGRVYMVDGWTNDLIEHLHQKQLTVKFIDIPFLEHESPSNDTLHDLVQSARRRMRLVQPKYHSSRLGHWLYRLSLFGSFKGDIKDKILRDEATPEETFHFYNLYKAFHPPSFHRYYELPAAVMAEKLRTLVKALYHTHPIYQKSSDSTALVAEVEPPRMLVLVGKPYVFPLMHFWQTYLAHEVYPNNITSFHTKHSQIALQDSIRKQSQQHALTSGEHEELDEDIIEALILQASSPSVRFTRPVKYIDPVYDHVPLPAQKPRDAKGALPRSDDPERSPYGFRYLE